MVRRNLGRQRLKNSKDLFCHVLSFLLSFFCHFVCHFVCHFFVIFLLFQFCLSCCLLFFCHCFLSFKFWTVVFACRFSVIVQSIFDIFHIFEKIAPKRQKMTNFPPNDKK